jgi:hypothetical protein
VEAIIAGKSLHQLLLPKITVKSGRPNMAKHPQERWHKNIGPGDSPAALLSSRHAAGS